MISMIGIPQLDTPLTIKNTHIRNRIVMPPMVRFGWADESGKATDRFVEHYARRARGGAGLIIVEATSVMPNGKLARSQLGIWDDEQIPGLRRIALACRKAGARVLIQLNHAGANTSRDVIGELPVAPSAVVVPGLRNGDEPPRALSQPEIRAIIRAFGLAAARAEAAGFDGVEIHGAHGFLVTQFLSPISNRRSDEYGGSLENRMRFAIEIIREVRGRVGPDFVIGYRLGAVDFTEGGLTREEGREVAQALEKEGVDLINVSRGLPGDSGPDLPEDYPFDCLVSLAAPIKESVKVPVIAVGRIVEPATAKAILAQGIADMVAVGRGMLADPEWANKAIAGRDSEIMKCRGCADGCKRASGGCPWGKD
ncbi:MAG: NADH:flavin oxidoreductase [Firmicutes bacterium]|nr:NADH:flavin oxidoreductase [Bacillota bacterium]